MRVIGIGGLPRSGKDSLAELLIHDGYFGISFGDVVRGFAYERHADKPDPISVENMTETSNWLRETRGPDVILHEALNAYEQVQATGGNYHGLVLWSVRAPVEVDWILARKGELVWVEADAAVRHERWVKHLRHGESAVSLKEFEAQEQLQWKPQPGIPVEVQMDISYVKKHATHTMVNNGDSYEVFLREAKALMRKLEKAQES